MLEFKYKSVETIIVAHLSNIKEIAPIWRNLITYRFSNSTNPRMPKITYT